MVFVNFAEIARPFHPGDEEYSRLLSQEGLVSNPANPSIQERQDLDNACLYLFKFLLGPRDPRWRIVEKYLEIKEQGLKNQHFENALLAIYLSDIPSYRNDYAKWAKPANVRQLCRAITNVSAAPLFENLGGVVQNSFYTECAVTNKITLGTDDRNITGCPEALYQLRMFARHSSQKAVYIGRVGFNYHREPHGVLSLTNMQGIPQGREIYAAFKKEVGVSPFNFLVQQMQERAQTIGAEVRGLKNQKQNPELYNTVFNREGVTRVDFERE